MYIRWETDRRDVRIALADSAKVLQEVSNPLQHSKTDIRRKSMLPSSHKSSRLATELSSRSFYDHLNSPMHTKENPVHIVLISDLEIRTRRLLFEFGQGLRFLNSGLRCTYPTCRK